MKEHWETWFEASLSKFIHNYSINYNQSINHSFNQLINNDNDIHSLDSIQIDFKYC